MERDEHADVNSRARQEQKVLNLVINMRLGVKDHKILQRQEEREKEYANTKTNYASLTLKEKFFNTIPDAISLLYLRSALQFCFEFKPS